MSLLVKGPVTQQFNTAELSTVMFQFWLSVVQVASHHTFSYLKIGVCGADVVRNPRARQPDGGKVRVRARLSRRLHLAAPTQLF